MFTFFVLSSPILSLIAWLIAKGSNWVNTVSSIKAAGAVSGQLCGAVFGGFMGSHFWGIVGLILMTVVFFGLGTLAGIVLGGWIANRYFAR
jgi:hypothetical protein